MRICMIAEGSYPYVTGGVSSWIQMLISNMPEHEFIIYTIGAEEKNRGKFNYILPKNIVEVQEFFLDTYLKDKGSYGKKFKVTTAEKEIFKNLITGEDLDWSGFFSCIQSNKFKNISDFFMSKIFFDVIELAYNEKYSSLPFTDFFWSVRSMLLPLFHLLKEKIPVADLYHSVSTGYAGIIASFGANLYNKPYILTEHGIYTREREEEIIKSNWVKSYFKEIWTLFFYTLSKCSYENASTVVTLFNKNKEIEIELGCAEEKIKIIPNGINTKAFEHIPPKEITDSTINIGAVIRMVPIKDIKTMLQSFAIVKEEIPNSHFYIMGPVEEDPEYFLECKQLVTLLNLKDVIFTGKVTIKDYIGKMDVLVLSSISEGQPLAILEGMACKKPFVSTNVGSCKELLYGVDDPYGRCGIIVPIMNYFEMGKAIIYLCNHKAEREQMGVNALNRVSNLYSLENFILQYKKLYNNYEEVTLWPE